ncbi:hypothetical protein [Cystobacter fuscus]|uniref:hypothetical protein n=1 Tax=Cystobacter fuscus TaxID=43 RepID=UPI0037BE2625
MEQATQEQARAVDADVAIMGAGIVGLFNALQYAKRGFRVLLLDNARGQKRSFKVGESFLISAEDFIHPEKFLERVPAWLRRWLPGSPSERLSRAIAVRGQTLLALFLLGYAYDWADTEVQKLLLQLGLLEPDSRVEPQETEAPSPVRQVAS